MPYFVVFLEGDQVSVNSLSGNRLRIGRGTDADLRLSDSSVALQHAVIEQDDAGWRVFDRGGMTGTFVGDERVKEKFLAAGDCINIGLFRLEVELLSRNDPLFLHVTRIEEVAQDSLSASSIVKTSAGDLLAVVEMAKATRRMAASNNATTTHEAAAHEATAHEAAASQATGVDSFVSMVASILPPEKGESFVGRPSDEGPLGGERIVDGAAAHDLTRDWPRQGLVALFLVLLTVGTVFAFFALGRLDAFNPGPLTSIHRTVANNDCAICHSGWQAVAAQSCQSSNCHGDIRQHQAAQHQDPPCLTCHTEHRPRDLRQVTEEHCIACHARLEPREGEVALASRISGFGRAEHPDLTPRRDPAALNFSHAKHLGQPDKQGRS